MSYVHDFPVVESCSSLDAKARVYVHDFPVVESCSSRDAKARVFTTEVGDGLADMEPLPLAAASGTCDACKMLGCVFVVGVEAQLFLPRPVSTEEPHFQAYRWRSLRRERLCQPDYR